jgi:hypothetical protein
LKEGTLGLLYGPVEPRECRIHLTAIGVNSVDAVRSGLFLLLAEDPAEQAFIHFKSPDLARPSCVPGCYAVLADWGYTVDHHEFQRHASLVWPGTQGVNRRERHHFQNDAVPLPDR